MNGEDKSIITGQSLLDDLNAERRKKGLHELPAVNSFLANTGSLARKDKTFKNSIDFFIQLFKKG